MKMLSKTAIRNIHRLYPKNPTLTVKKYLDTDILKDTLLLYDLNKLQKHL